MSEAEIKTTKSKKSKSKNPFVKTLIGIFYFILLILIALTLWIGICAFDKKSPTELIPNDFTAYIHADSLYDSINPMLDLQAADIFLASEEMSDIRGLFMTLRQSDFRENKFVKYLGRRKVNASFYNSKINSNAFIATIDLGILSAASRLSKFFVPLLNIQGLSYIQQNGINYFKYQNDSATFYITPVKNLLVISNNYNYFEQSINGNNEKAYSKENLNLLTNKTNDAIRLIVDSKKLAATFFQDNELFSKLTSVISEKTLSSLSIKICDEQINLYMEVPFELSKNLENDKELSSTIKLLKLNSKKSDLATRLSNSVQYYTIINAGTLKDLINGIIPLTPKEKNFAGILQNAENLSSSFFNLSLDELLYSWTGDEFAMLGLEELPDPILAIKISDETKRKFIFEKIMQSVLLTENKSLILNGVRIPRIEIPTFLQSVLKLFNVELPKPYYLVFNNYIYFSQSAESISTFYTTLSSGQNISYNKNWKELSEKAITENSLTMYYDLERSKPFFTNSTSVFAQILELYTLGRADLAIKNNSLIFSLNAISKRAGSLKNIPGFPISLDSKSDFVVKTCSVQKPETIFWLENNQTVKAMDVKKTQIYSYDLGAKSIIQTSSINQEEKLLALTSQNELYMFNNKLEIEDGYPIQFSKSFVSEPFLSATESFIPQENGNFTVIKNKKVSELKFDIDDLEDANILCHYDGQKGIIYERSFLGKIFVLNKDKCINKNDPIVLDSIGFGLPAYTEEKNYVYQIGFVSQSGELFIWEVNGDFISEKFHIQLDGIFFANVISCGKYFFALSDKAELFRIDAQDGSVLSIQIDSASAKEGMIATTEHNGKTYISVGIDGNKIYNFTCNLELVSGFPIAARGICGFADVNGDSYSDCFGLTIDGKLNAWNLR